MAAYFIVDIQEITDPQLYKEYSKEVNATVVKYGGEFVVRGGAHESIEGDWQSQRLVILQFKDADGFKSWYHSPEYSKLRAMRFNASTSRAVMVEGI